MTKTYRWVALIALCLLVQPACAALNILACEPEWGSLAKELGGDKVDVYTAITAFQDAHHIEARPSLIARARRADLMVCTGAQLEIGWVPLLQTQSGNPRIQVGAPGYFEAALQVPLIEVPTLVDRSLGDVHPAGNPHIHLDPRNIAKVAAALSARMMALDAPDAAYIQARTRSFLDRWQKAIARWEQEAQPLKGMPVVVYHQDLSYLIHWLGMREIGALEPKPGLPPTTEHMKALLVQLAKDPAKVVVRSPYNDPRAAEFLAERARIPSILLPYTVGGTERAKDLFGLYDDTLARLLAVAK